MVYRSKQKEYMENIKESVLFVTKGMKKEDRKFAIDYLRKHVKIDDLHQYAIKHFKNKPIVLGFGSFNASVVVLTKNPIEPEVKVKLDKAWEKLKIPSEKIYYTHLRFVSTKKKQDIRQEIVEKLLDIISPNVVLTFDNLELKVPKEQIVLPYSPSVLINGSKEDKMKITKILKNCRTLIIN